MTQLHTQPAQSSAMYLAHSLNLHVFLLMTSTTPPCQLVRWDGCCLISGPALQLQQHLKYIFVHYTTLACECCCKTTWLLCEQHAAQVRHLGVVCFQAAVTAAFAKLCYIIGKPVHPILLHVEQSIAIQCMPHVCWHRSEQGKTLFSLPQMNDLIRHPSACCL